MSSHLVECVLFATETEPAITGTLSTWTAAHLQRCACVTAFGTDRWAPTAGSYHPGPSVCCPSLTQGIICMANNKRRVTHRAVQIWAGNPRKQYGVWQTEREFCGRIPTWGMAKMWMSSCWGWRHRSQRKRTMSWGRTWEVGIPHFYHYSLF